MSWPLIKLLPVKTNFQFVKFARLAAALSIVLSVASIVSVFNPGLNMGIDFKGGSRLEVTVPGATVDVGKVRDTLRDQNLGDVQVQAFGKPNSALVNFQTPAGDDPAKAMTRVKTALSQAFPGITFAGDAVVGPKVSGELFSKGLQALGWAIALMLVYIWFRFRLSFGFGAVVALFHDVILTFGLIVLFRLEFTLNMIAALLTIIGYSMNDTVVVFDRLRENLRKYKKMPLREVIDLSINETLSRTVITGLTALLALGGLAVFGGEALYGMSIALLFGIAIGTYSSIYIAAPIVLIWGIKRGDREEEDEPKPIDWSAASRSPKT